jgi:hypothetical protein
VEHLVTVGGLAVVAGVVAVFAAALAYDGYRRRRQAAVAAEAGVAAPAAVTTGPTVVEGTVVVDDPVTGPATGHRAAVVDYRVVSNSTFESRRQIGAGSVRRPFRVEDGAGGVAVDPAGADLRLSAPETVTVDPEEYVPPSVEAFERETGVDLTGQREFGDAVSVDYEHEYRERSVTAGDEVVVVGEAVPASEADVPTDAGRAVVAGDGAALVADPDAFDGVRGTGGRLRAWAQLLGGGAVAVAAGGLALLFAVGFVAALVG